MGCYYKHHTNELDQVIIPDDLFLSTQYSDSYQELMQSKFKILVYIDSTACGNCWAKSIVDWYDIVNYVESKESLVSLLIIFAPKRNEIKLWKDLSEYDPLNYPIFIDTGYSMAINNDFSSTKGSFMGLLNEQGKVLVKKIGKNIN